MSGDIDSDPESRNGFIGSHSMLQAAAHYFDYWIGPSADLVARPSLGECSAAKGAPLETGPLALGTQLVVHACNTNRDQWHQDVVTAMAHLPRR